MTAFAVGLLCGALLAGWFAHRSGFDWRSEFFAGFRGDLQALRNIRREYPDDLTPLGRFVQWMAGGYLKQQP